MPAARSGESWTKSEEDTLVELFEKHKSAADLANWFDRTAGGITSRLVKLGLIEFVPATGAYHKVVRDPVPWFSPRAHEEKTNG